MSTCFVRGCQEPPIQILIWTANNHYYGTLHRFCNEHKLSDLHIWSRQLVVRDE